MVIIKDDDMIAKIKEAEERGRKRMEEIKNREISELEEKRREREEIIRLQKERTAKLVNTFKGYIYKLVLPGLFYRGIKEEMRIKRKQTLKEYKDLFPPITDAIGTILRNFMGSNPGVKTLWDIHLDEKSPVTFLYIASPTGEHTAEYNLQGGTSNGDKEESVRLVHSICKSILENLKALFDSNSFSGYIMNFVGKYVANGSFLQVEYHLPHEIDRLEFDSFGALS